MNGVAQQGHIGGLPLRNRLGMAHFEDEGLIWLALFNEHAQWSGPVRNQGQHQLLELRTRQGVQLII